MKNSLMLILSTLLPALLPGIVFSQQPTAAITAEKIDQDIYVVKGGVANTGFIIGETVTAIDAQMTADAAQKMIAEIKKVSSKPLTRIILTHSDGDHVQGLAGFPQGLEIVSSAGARKEMAEELKTGRPSGLEAYLPNRTFETKLDIDGIQLIHLGAAHTSGDIVVLLAAHRIAFVGDLVFIGRDPLIHRHKGGTSTGLVKTLKALLELNVDRYVPGHGNIVTKNDIQGELKSLEEKQARIRELIGQGKSLEETKRAFGISDSPAGGMRFPSLVEVIYLEYSAGK